MCSGWGPEHGPHLWWMDQHHCFVANRMVVDCVLNQVFFINGMRSRYSRNSRIRELLWEIRVLREFEFLVSIIRFWCKRNTYNREIREFMCFNIWYAFYEIRKKIEKIENKNFAFYEIRELFENFQKPQCFSSFFLKGFGFGGGGIFHLLGQGPCPGPWNPWCVIHHLFLLCVLHVTHQDGLTQTSCIIALS